MIEIEIHKIDILPTIFVRHEDDADVVKWLTENNEVVEKRFTKNMLANIKNPKYLLVGIITGVGVMQINVVDASEFEQMFKEEWKILIK
jgi:hypothetical protein